MKTFYQIIASGQNKLGGYGKFHSKRIFASLKKAEEYIPQFKKDCCDNPFDDPKSVSDLEPEFTKFIIVELEMNDD